jgi:hypothetical protein
MRVCHSPELIAAYHGLHRLCVPRHPPHTLVRLTLSQLGQAKHALYRTSDASLQSAQPRGQTHRCYYALTSVRIGQSPHCARKPSDAINVTIIATNSCQSANNQNRDQGCAERATTSGTFGPILRRGRPTRRSGKEVIQPQVPLRLPCYDFAPVTALAFGGLVPCGFRHRLRALTASMA